MALARCNAITSPATGLLIYQMDSTLAFTTTLAPGRFEWIDDSSCTTYGWYSKRYQLANRYI